MADSAKFGEELRKEMSDFKSKLEREVRKELRELKASLDFCHAELEKVKHEKDEIAKENKELKAIKTKLASDCSTLSKQAAQLENRVTVSEQYSRNRNHP
ncbi:hypothetical protein HPB49_007304 [Dermacentor silvarum]|uniref:Uncharacterized protein n=1 Tax=Dermacentor silvarum TaxID=543639 RepID=A0ACB8CQJ1_DERSI|nr:hypothetical protein HPB49_007304 [Dermacentor silvarum]